ncbi:MAG: hypothetical protein ACYC64_11060 [Armatimonadota bacterium]
MTRLHRVAVAVCAVVLLAAGMISVGINASEKTKSIRIIYSNDLLGYAEPCG